MVDSGIPDNLKVTRGQVTFDAEGNDDETSRYFSRVIHWPGNELSGVTVGRGYDMGNRSVDTIKRELVNAGVDAIKANKLSDCSGLKGELAQRFVDANKLAIGLLTHSQQIKLFELIYPGYEQRAEQNYNKWTGNEVARVLWDDLHPPIRDILVDFVYQGFTKGPRPMRAGMNNSFDELISYIEGSAVLQRYEPGRNRVKYLQARKSQFS